MLKNTLAGTDGAFGFLPAFLRETTTSHLRPLPDAPRALPDPHVVAGMTASVGACRPFPAPRA